MEMDLLVREEDIWAPTAAQDQDLSTAAGIARGTGCWANSRSLGAAEDTADTVADPWQSQGAAQVEAQAAASSYCQAPMSQVLAVLGLQQLQRLVHSS